MSFFGLASLLLMIVDLTLAEYDPSTPHRVENFDPAEADPAGRLTCLGPLPPWPLPVPLEGDWDPNSFTLQELCAKPQYGGRGPDQHLGGYCPRYPFRAYPPNYSRGLEKAIAFDDSPGAQTARSLANPRTLIYCRSRCFCSYGLDDTTIQPRFVPHLDAEYLQYPASKTYQIMIDEVDDFRVAPQSHRGKDDWGILSTWLWMVEEINQDDHLGRMEPVSISRENTIRCSGPKPTWPLPEPYTAAHFHSLTALCAVQLSNGFPSANAGGYCHRDTFQETQDVWFSDEMTPRIDWTWDNLAASAAIRFHCWRHCECSVDGQPNNRTVAPLWHFLASADLVLKPDGAVDVNFRPVTNPSASSTMPVLPASSGTKPAAGTCAYLARSPQLPRKLRSSLARATIGVGKDAQGKEIVAAPVYVYPIKSLRGIPVPEAVLSPYGIEHDRKFMLLKVHHDDAAKSPLLRRLENMHVAYFPEMTLFHTSIDPPTENTEPLITVEYRPPGSSSVNRLGIPLQPDTSGLSTVEVTMHRSPTKAYEMQKGYSDWFSRHFGYEVILVYLGDHQRPVLGNLAPSSVNQQSRGGWYTSLTEKLPSFGMSTSDRTGISFADCAPLLFVTEESLASVSSLLPGDEEMDITKFRPNVVVSGSPAAFDEDFWGSLTLGPVEILLTQNCARCQSINIDYMTGKPGKGESGTVLKKLMKDRRVDKGTKYSPIFGRYGFPPKQVSGKTIHIGDAVTITKRNEERTTFDWPGLNN
ncbi:MAG: hypothetical protein M1817_000638 [Caeruleum heppii]|nr:MAG: hypothetical protein M1817_000638 [Caeruleum heppii]